MKKLLLALLFSTPLMADIKWDYKEKRYYSTNNTIDQYEYHILATYFNELIKIAIDRALPLAEVISEAIDALSALGTPEAYALLEDLNKIWGV